MLVIGKIIPCHVHTLQNHKLSRNEGIHTTCSAKSEMRTKDSTNKLINTLFCTQLLQVWDRRQLILLTLLGYLVINTSIFYSQWGLAIT